MTALRDLTTLYLVLTLAATGLAKLRRWRTAAAVLVTDAVIPRPAVPVVVILVSLFEIALAVLLATGADAFTVEVATVALLSSFGAYRMVAVNNSGVVGCGCAGTARSVKKTIGTVSATMAGSAVQVGTGVILLVTDSQRESQWLEMASSSVLLIPFIALLVGHVRGVRMSSMTERGSVHITTAGELLAGQDATPAATNSLTRNYSA